MFRRLRQATWGAKTAGWYADGATVSFLVGDALCAKAVHLPLMLFPELGALTLVVLTKPKSAWARSPVKLVLTPTLTGSLGVLVTRFFAYDLFSILLVVAGSILILRVLRSDVVPALSAGLLPLVFGIAGISYLVAVVATLSILAIVTAGLGRFRAQERAGEQTPPATGTWPPVGAVSLLLFLLVAYGAVVATGMRLILYPPLVVAAFQMLVTPERCPWIERPVIFVVACGLCAVAGTFAFGFFGQTVLSVAIASTLAIVVLRWLGVLIPPAIAVALIPWLIEHPSAIYPAAIFLGTGLLCFTSAASRSLRLTTTISSG